MSFTNTDPQNHQSENTWFTPKYFIDCLGPFDLDPCTVSFRPFNTAKKHIEHDLGNCGLKTQWIGNVWLNPPYGKEISPFIDKFIEHKKGIMLIFARMDNVNVQKLIKSGSTLFLLRKRILFINKNHQKSSNAGTGSMLVFYDSDYIEKIKNSNLEGVFIKGLI